MHSIFENQLLRSLSLKVQNRLCPHLERVSLPTGKVLYESGETFRYVYFPTCSIVSLFYVLGNGASTEIAMVGNEGLVGISAILGGASCNHRAVIQSDGYIYRISKHKLIEEMQLLQSETLSIFMLYIQSLLTQISQTAICNRHHTIEQQLCRRILTSIDRLPNQQLNMTQELIANMLGVRREGVTEAAGRLQKIGAIEYSRGHINVLNRAMLEKSCCECYFDVKKETNRLLPQRTDHNSPNNIHACDSTSFVPNTLNKVTPQPKRHIHEVKNSSAANSNVA